MYIRHNKFDFFFPKERGADIKRKKEREREKKRDREREIFRES